MALRWKLLRKEAGLRVQLEKKSIVKTNMSIVNRVGATVTLYCSIDVMNIAKNATTET